MNFKTVAAVSLFLAQMAAWALSESACSRQMTEPATDANCSFDGKTLCSWMNADNDQLDWNFKKGWNKTGGIYMTTFWKNKGDTAYLIGPVMCEEEETAACLQFRYMMDRQRGVKLSFFSCRNWPKGNCTNKPAWTTTDWFEGKWQTVRIPLKLAGQFQFVIEGKKHEEMFLVSESDIYLDDIVYTKAPCKAEALPPDTTNGRARSTNSKTGTKTDLVISSIVTSGNGARNWTTTDATLTGNYKESAEHFGIMKDDGESNETPVESSGMEQAGVQHTVIVVVVALVLVLIVTTVVVVVVVSRRRLSRNVEGSKNVDAMKYKREDHTVLAVSNELYSVIGAADNLNTTHTVINEKHPEEPKCLTTKTAAESVTTPYRSGEQNEKRIF